MTIKKCRVTFLFLSFLLSFFLSILPLLMGVWDLALFFLFGLWDRKRRTEKTLYHAHSLTLSSLPFSNEYGVRMTPHLALGIGIGYGHGYRRWHRGYASALVSRALRGC